jgi:uncharacterized integral membrane protein
VRLAVAAVLLVSVTAFLVLFVLFNTQTVAVSLVFADTEAPLVLALVLSAALGGLLAGLAGLSVSGRRKRR